MPKVIIRSEGVPIAEVSFDLRLFENISRLEAIRKMAGADVSLEVEEAHKVEFNNATLFAAGILQLLRANTPCVSPNTSATPA